MGVQERYQMWDEKDAFYTKGDEDDWWWGKARKEIVRQCMKEVIPPEANILEIGAGYGSMTRMLTGLGTVRAIEPYREAVSYLREELKIHAYHSTFESFPETEKYDVVTCFDVLEHIEDDRSALAKMERLVNDKGFLVLTVPAYQFLWNRHDEINHHFRRYRKNELIKKMPGNLSIKKISYFNTFLFPAAILDKLLLSRKKQSSSFNPNAVVNRLLYRIFSAEKTVLRFFNFPFGVSLLLIAEKTNQS